MSEAVVRPLGLAAERPLGAPFAWRRAVPLLLAAPLLLFMLAFYALPVATMLMRSVSDPVWSLSHYAGLADDAVFQKAWEKLLLGDLQPNYDGKNRILPFLEVDRGNSSCLA